MALHLSTRLSVITLEEPREISISPSAAPAFPAALATSPVVFFF